MYHCFKVRETINLYFRYLFGKYFKVIKYRVGMNLFVLLMTLMPFVIIKLDWVEGKSKVPTCGDLIGDFVKRLPKGVDSNTWQACLEAIFIPDLEYKNQDENPFTNDFAADVELIGSMNVYIDQLPAHKNYYRQLDRKLTALRVSEGTLNSTLRVLENKLGKIGKKAELNQAADYKKWKVYKMTEPQLNQIEYLLSEKKDDIEDLYDTFKYVSVNNFKAACSEYNEALLDLAKNKVPISSRKAEYTTQGLSKEDIDVAIDLCQTKIDPVISSLGTIVHDLSRIITIRDSIVDIIIGRQGISSEPQPLKNPHLLRRLFSSIGLRRAAKTKQINLFKTESIDSQMTL